MTITFPDGKVYKFEGRATPSSQRAAPISGGSYSFVPIPPTVGSLTAIGVNDYFVKHPDGQTAPTGDNTSVPVELLRANLSLYNPKVFQLTTAEGMVLIIEQGKGLRSLTDLNGNTLTVSDSGLIHSSGKSVVFSRDAEGRITRITDPSGHAMTYSYDDAGNLSTFTDRENNTTSFTYNNVHGLLSIQDPRGITPIRNEYDDSGRLTKHIDAFGKEIVYTHNIPGQFEQIRDRLNNTTSYRYDDNGNVLDVIDQEGGLTSYTYDLRDNETSMTKFAADGVTILSRMTYTYDSQDNKLTETNHLNETTEYTYGANRRMLTVKDPEGRITTNSYDFKHNLFQVKDARNKISSYTYNYVINPGGQPTSMTDALLNETAYFYDFLGNQTQVKDANLHDTFMSYDASNNLITQTTTRTIAGGVVETLITRTEYDAQNRPTKTIYPDTTFTTVEYNSIGKQSKTKDQLGRETLYEYDELGRLKKTTYPDGKFEESTYDDEGRRLTSKDRAGRVTTYEYDKVGRLTKTIFPDQKFTRTVYDKAGQVVESYDELNNRTKYKYDTAGRRIEVEDALGKKTTFTYDKNGNQKTMTDANLHTTTYEYDELNRRVKTIFHDTTFTQTEYDDLGRRVAEIDQAQKRTEFRYDKLGRLKEVEDALHNITKYEYNELGQQTKQIDARLKTTSYEYDQLGRRVKRTLPPGMNETYTYDIAGNLKTRTNFRGKVTTYDYDNLNRLEKKTPDPNLNEPVVMYTYTASGQRDSMTDASGTTTYQYDSRDRLLAKITPQGTLTYTYDDAGNILTLRSSNTNGVSMDYSYDALNRLKTATDNRRNNVTTYNYDDVGNLKDYAYGNGVQHAYTYDTLNRLTNVTGSKNMAALSSYTYVLGASGHRANVTELSGRKAEYGYDSIYRLTSEAVTGDPHAVNGSVGYTHDAVGNRLSRTSTLAGVTAQSQTFDDNDRLSTDVYDLDGNTVNSEGKVYSYDFENRIRSVDNGQIAIVYDGDGNRVSKTVNGVTVKYLVDTNNLTGYAQVVEELSGTAVQRVYAYGLDLISQDQPINAVWTQSFYGYDGHGSVRFLTDAAGIVTDTFDYDAFGILLHRTGTTPNLYQYCGEQFDPDLGFYYLRARYMNTSTGRFWTMDSYEGDQGDPMSLHKYAYGNSNPISHNDPTGHWSVLEMMAVGAIGLTLAVLPGCGSSVKTPNCTFELDPNYAQAWGIKDGRVSYEFAGIFEDRSRAFTNYSVIQVAILNKPVISREKNGREHRSPLSFVDNGEYNYPALEPAEGPGTPFYQKIKVDSRQKFYDRPSFKVPNGLTITFYAVFVGVNGNKITPLYGVKWGFSVNDDGTKIEKFIGPDRFEKINIPQDWRQTLKNTKMSKYELLE